MTILLILAGVFIISLIIMLFCDEFSDAKILWGIVSLLSSIFLMLFVCCYILSSKSVQYINAKYGTKYTTEDYFWNGDFIKSDLKINDKIIDNSSKIKLELNQTEESNDK